MISQLNNELPSATTLLKSLRAVAMTKQRISTLDRLVRACDVLCTAGKDFTLRELEEYCRDTFGKGPNAQTVSNDQGLRAYVEARKNEMGVKNSPKPNSALNHDIESIPDLNVRSRIRLLAEDYRLTKKRLRILNESLRELSPPLDLDDLFCINGKSKSVQNDKVDPIASSAEIVALETITSFLIDGGRLRRAGLDVDDGDIVSRGLRETIITAKDLNLLANLLAKLTKEKSQ